LLTTKWKFLDYCRGNSNPIEDWYQSLSLEGKLLFDNILKTNQKTENPYDWIQFKSVRGNKYKGIWELKFKADQKAYRMLLILDKKVQQRAVLLVGCYHKQRRYFPPDALDTALRNKKEFESGKAGWSEREIKDYI